MTTVTSILDQCDTPAVVEIKFTNTWQRLEEQPGKPLPSMPLTQAISRIQTLCAEHTIPNIVFSLRIVHGHTGEHLWPPKP